MAYERGKFDFSNFFASEALADVKIFVEEGDADAKFMFAHKLLLSASSKHFAEMVSIL